MHLIMSERSEICHRETQMNIFQGSIYRLFETITVWAVEGGAILMDHPVMILNCSQLNLNLLSFKLNLFLCIVMI